MLIKEYVEIKKANLKQEILTFTTPIKLGIVQVGDNPASNVYIKGKIKDCNEIGIIPVHIKLDENITQEELNNVVKNLNEDETITGFIVQLPLPKHLDANKITSLIDPKKDVDGFNKLSKFVPATPKGIITFLKDEGYDFTDINALVIGRSEIVGKPMAKLLTSLNANTTLIHSKTSEENKRTYIENSDLIVVATGKINTLNSAYNYKKDAYIIDVGINKIDGKLCGDCENNLPVKFQSPVPGGVGLLTRLALLLNVVEAYKNGL